MKYQILLCLTRVLFVKSKEQFSVNLSCPHGEVLVSHPDYPDYPNVETCGSANLEADFITNLDMQIKDWEKGYNVILQAPKGDNFSCPDGLEREWMHETKNKYFLGLNEEGDLELKGENISYIEFGEVVDEGNFAWKSDHFCISYTDIEYIDYDYYTHGVDGQLNVTYAICYNTDTDGRCRPWLNFLATFKPIAFAVSIFFLLLTLLAYYWLDKIKMQDLTTRMTMIFVVNLAIAYGTSIAAWTIDEDKLGTPGCILIGYLTQYFFVSSMFWINTMGFNLWKVFNFHSSKKSENIGRFLKYCFYAQGVPFLISIITAIADKSRPKGKVTPHFPNMGVVRCSLGEHGGHDRPTYLGSAKFIYMDLFMLLIQITNIFFLGSICLVLFKGWENQARLDKIKGNEDWFKRRRQQATLIIRLFVILGVPWIFEVISTGIAHEHGECAAKWPSFFMDFTLCLAGFLIFLTLVVKRTLIVGMRIQLSKSMTSMSKSMGSGSGGSTGQQITSASSTTSNQSTTSR